MKTAETSALLEMLGVADGDGAVADESVASNALGVCQPAWRD